MQARQLTLATSIALTVTVILLISLENFSSYDFKIQQTAVLDFHHSSVHIHF